MGISGDNNVSNSSKSNLNPTVILPHQKDLLDKINQCPSSIKVFDVDNSGTVTLDELSVVLNGGKALNVGDDHSREFLKSNGHRPFLNFDSGTSYCYSSKGLNWSSGETDIYDDNDNFIGQRRDDVIYSDGKPMLQHNFFENSEYSIHTLIKHNKDDSFDMFTYETSVKDGATHFSTSLAKGPEWCFVNEQRNNYYVNGQLVQYSITSLGDNDRPVTTYYNASGEKIDK